MPLPSFMNYAHDFAASGCDPASTGAIQSGCTGLPNVAAGSQQLNQLITIGMAVVGAIAVLALVIAALHFVTSQGEPQEVAKARSTLIYVAVGVAVIVTAEAIVAFLLGYL